MRYTLRLMLGLVFAGAAAFAGAPDPVNPVVKPAAAVPVTTEEEAWSGYLAAYAYFPPSNRDYVQPTLSADRGSLHFEARYNYEARDTGSAWVGYNTSGGGDAVEWEFTPMMGVVLGDTKGFAPGFKGALYWRKLTLYSEGEYFIDSSSSKDDYFYTWTEFTWSPIEWFRIGVVVQRTRAYDTELDVQRGFLAGVSVGQVDFTAHVFNPDKRHPLWVFAAAWNF